MSMLEQIYQQVIMERSRKPRFRGPLEPRTHEREGLNPSCGDELELHLRLEDDRIAAAAVSGQGCAISQASADLMAEAITGLTLAQARERSAEFKAMIHGEEPAESLGELQALQGVRRLHARVKCATLPWTTLEGILDDGESGGRTIDDGGPAAG